MLDIDGSLCASIGNGSDKVILPSQVEALKFGMEEFFDHILSSPWVNMSGQPNGMTSDAMGAFQGPLKRSTMPLMPSSQISGSLASQAQSRDVQDDSSTILNGGNAAFPPSKTLVGTAVQRQQEVHDPVIASPVADHARHDNRPPTGGILTADGSQENVRQSMQRLVEHNATGGSLGLQLNTSGSVAAQGTASQFLPAVGSSSRAAMTLLDSASGGSSSSEASGFQQPLGDSHSSPQVAPLWSQSYTGVSALPSAIGQGKLEAFNLHGETIKAEGHHLGKRSHREENVLASENRSVTTDQCNVQGTVLTSYTGAQVAQTSLARSSGTQTHQQTLRTQTLQLGEANSMQQYGNHSTVSQLQSVAGGGGTVNGAARPRVRARRGQATDPHSIAERLRRERIAERMKSLQELVPNSNKTDKASMLDEIIEYVKFLQLQVKVLSMSRLGGAGAVAPLIADVPSEGSGGLVSAALGQAGAPLVQSQDGLAFEQEVAKLMESNMTTAMQYLQNKGLCLMPIALAIAISSSSGKPSLASVPTKGVESTSEGHKTDLPSVVLPLNSSSVAVGLAVSSSGGDAPIKDNSTKKDAKEEGMARKSNGIAPGLPSDVPKVVTKNMEELPRRGQ